MALSDNIKEAKYSCDTKWPWRSLLEFQCNDDSDKVVRLVQNYENLSFFTEKYWNTGVLRHWKMNDNSADSSGIVIDSSPNLGHAYAVRQTSELHVTGKINGALNFDGDTDCIDAGADSDMNISTFSASIWVKADEKDTIRTLIGRHEVANDWWQLIQRADGIRFELHNGSTQFNTAYTDTYAINTWLHFVITMDAVNGIAKLYYNAVLISTITGITNFDVSHTADLMIGSAGINFESYAEESNWKGPIDNVVYFDKVLSLAEVELLYHEGDGTEKLPATYTGFNFNLGIVVQTVDGKLSQTSLIVSGITELLQADLEAMDGAVEATIVHTTIHAKHIYEDFSDFTEIWDVLTTHIEPDLVSFAIGAPSPLFQRYPLLRFVAKRCPYMQFGGPRCKYAGAETECNRTLTRCRELENSANYGGDPELEGDTIRFI